MILWCYTIATLAALFVPLLPLAEELQSYSGSWWPGFLYVAACYLGFVGAYVICKYATRRPNLQSALQRSGEFSFRSIRTHTDVRTFYLMMLAAWALIGASVIVLQVQTTVGFGTYMGMLSQGAKGVEAARGATILIDSSQGGLPGIVKVWNQNCTTSLLLTVFLIADGRKINGILPKLLVAIVAFCYVLRNFISMDRLALLALVPAAFYLWQVSSWKIRKIVLLMGCLVFCLAEVQSMRRDSHNGALGFFILYVQSGMVNANLMIDTLQGGHTNGFGSIFSSLFWVLKAAGINVLSSDIQYTWMWNDAHNSFGILFLDFGWLAPLVTFAAGALCQRLDRPALYQGSRFDWGATARVRMRAFVAYSALSTMFVPAYVGPEFPITLFSLAAAAWFEHRYPGICFRRSVRPFATRQDRFTRTLEPEKSVMVLRPSAHS